MHPLIGPRELRVLLVLAEELHFGRTAGRLGMAQPQLSNLVKRIECILNLQLFTRRPKVNLTAAGSTVLEAVRRATRDLELTVAEARELATGRKGGVRLGFSDAAMLTDLPRLLNEFTRTHPDVRLRLTEGHSQHLLERLERGEFDLVISRQKAEAPELNSFRLIPDTIVLAAPDRHSFAARPSIRLAELREEGFVMFARSAAPAYHDRIIGACRANGLEPQITQEVDTRAATLALVAAGFGLALATTASKRIGYPGVTFCEIADDMPDVSFWASHAAQMAPAADRLLASISRSTDLTRDLILS